MTIKPGLGLCCVVLAAGLLSVFTAHAIIFPPGSGPDWLDFWTFNNTNTWVTERGYAPASFTNITASDLGDYWAAILDDTNAPAWLRYNITENNGTNHLRVDRGSVMFWFAPNWTGTNEGGTGPGEWSRLIEVGSYTTNASYGWWSLYVDPEGVNIYFSAQTNDGSEATYLSAPIDWDITNRWHFIALTYSATNTSLYLDAVPLTNGLPLTYWPGSDVLTNGFFIGSDSNGLTQAHGMFDDLATYDHPVTGRTVTNTFWSESMRFFANPMNSANLSSAPSSPTFTPSFNAVTGSGNLITNGPAATCTNSSSVWFTNVAATLTNGAVNLKFTIAGGSNGIPYDVFANSVLDFTATTNHPWAWMGQGYHCTNYSLILSNSAVFLILGKPQDSDSDGLTDAYERLVSKTNPLLWDTDGDGKGDGWEVLIGTDPLNYDAASSLEMPEVGSSYLRILAPDLLELVRVTSDTSDWNFVTNGILTAPSTNQFQVKSGSSSLNVTQVGYKRRPLYAPFEQYDLRIENTLLLRLASTNWASSNATIEVTTTNTALWPATLRFVAPNKPLRYSPALHVNQEGYSPTYQKKAMIGYYLGSLGEMQISTNLGFKLVNAASGSQAYPAGGTNAPLTARPDNPSTWPVIGTNLNAQYQMVLEADFSSFNGNGQYQLVVPGLGASYPFRIDEGTAMKLARTYALGLYHQRCGSGPGGQQVNDPQFTRFSHDNCHVTNATVPLPASSYADTWFTMSNNYGSITYTANTDNPPQRAPAVTNYSAFLFGYSNNPAQGIPVSGGHHDAGDYSKYTLSSALLVHILTFAADNLGLTNFYNFGLPESTNTIPDILDEAKWEADFLAKMQDSDGGFYFLAYPKTREYEGNVLPQYGDPQIVWPKTTAATAAAVGALAEIGSSPSFRRQSTNFQQAADTYLAKAQLGWAFLTNAINRYGKDGCYQRITTYGDEFTHDDELAWAASALFAATGNTNYQRYLRKWFPNPAEVQNGFSFQRVDPTNNLPTSSFTNVTVAYLPVTNSLTTATNKIWFRIFDAEGQMVVNTNETAIPHITDIPAVTNKLYDLKTNLNAHPNDLNRNAALTLVSKLVGNCEATWLYGYVHMYSGYGCAIRDYAFAARSGRLSTTNLNPGYLQQCESEITNRAAGLRLWSAQNAYGTSFDPDSKNLYVAGWYFAGDRTFDLAVANQIESDTNIAAANTSALIENFNYEAGRNPLNVSRVTGLGWYRQREIVDQYAQNNSLAVLPPSGIPLGNIANRFLLPLSSSAWHYGDLNLVCFPAFERGSNTFALYDRWAETYNIQTEFVQIQTARSLASAAYLVTSPTLKTQVWRSATATIIFPNGPPALNTKCVAQLVSTQDLSQAQILWDPGRPAWNALGQEPAFGTNFIFIPTTIGDPPLQAEAVLPDGRRFFAVTNLSIYDPANGGTAFTNDTNTVALYHFDDVNNPFADSSGHGYTLTAYGKATPANNANWMASPTGKVARFGGVGDYLEFTAIPYTMILSNTNSAVTIEARIYPRAYKTDVGANAQEIISLFQFYNSSTDAAEWVLYYEPPKTPDAPQLYANGRVLLNNTAWSQSVSLNTWHSLKVTFAPSGITTAYLDGVFQGATNSPPSYTSGANWRLTLGHFDGDIDEVRISNKVRP